MIKSKKSKSAALLLCIFCMLTACTQTRDAQNAQSGTVSNADSVAQPTENVEYPSEPKSGTAQSADTCINLSNNAITVDGNGAQISGNTVIISAGGSYIISGTLDNGQLVVDTDDEEKVEIFLNGAKISSTESCAVNIINAPKKVELILCEESVNIFSDGSDYYLADSDDENAVGAAIFSRDDLEISGSGEIYVTSNCCKGIFSKDDLEISGASVFVSAFDDGIRGKDSLVISNATVNVSSGGDGLRTSNDSDEDKGNMTICDSQIIVESSLDGIQSQGELDIQNSTVSIVSGGGYENAAEHTNDFPSGGFGGFGGMERPDDMPSNFDDFSMPDNMEKPDNIPDMPQGGFEMPENAEKPDDIPDMPQGGFEMPENAEKPDDILDMPQGGFDVPNAQSTQNQQEQSDTEQSTKGIKSEKNLTICGGSISVNSADDAIHSNLSCTVESGCFTVYAGDDGFHADDTLTISGGDISIMSSYEGLEASDVCINGGKIVINAADDGINASDGSNVGFFDAQDVSIVITSGDIIINAQGDGVDSNGTIAVSGGTLIVYGPTSGGDGALDYQSTFEVTGGTILAVGSMQMAQSVSSSDFGVLNFNLNVDADSLMQIADENGNEIICIKTPKNVQNVVFTSPQIESGKAYIVSVGGSYEGESENGVFSGGTYENAENSQTFYAK